MTGLRYNGPVQTTSSVETFVPRAMCARCRRPTVVCYCAALPSLKTRTKVVILQHPRERDMPIGTARMASLCLSDAQLHVGMRWDEHAALRASLASPTHPPILLYPGPGARNILTDPPPGPVTLVVVDGTWSQAKTLVRDNPILQALPRYAFETPELSHYRIRREPRAEYVSTIEALMHVLGALENDPDRFRALLAPLNAMVDAQLAAQKTRPNRVRQPQPPKPPKLALPPHALARFEDLVVVVGEANAWPYDQDRTTPRDELVHLLAQRVATGETFDMLARPQHALSPTTPFHTQLTAEALAAAAPRAEVLAKFAAFTRPTDIMLAWGHYGPSLIIENGAALPSLIDLRAAAQRFANVKLGTLDAYAESLGALPAPIGPGRGGVRLALLAHIVRTWRALDVASLRSAPLGQLDTDGV